MGLRADIAAWRAYQAAWHRRYRAAQRERINARRRLVRSRRVTPLPRPRGAQVPPAAEVWALVAAARAWLATGQSFPGGERG
ncbi:MAG TPA: hypothetical protein VEY89_02440 [Candidatus Dormibacteraeota bacterium]|nr:hypothetical protein [Candidatus Dormibacteraeota bacterium]